MSQPLETRRVDTDRIDTGGRRSWRTTVAALVVGVVLGAALGLLYGVTRPETSGAVTALSVLPDSTISADTNSNSPDQDATAFIQAQLVVLNGDQLKTTVREQLNLASNPDVTATQIGQTYVVQVTATAPTQQQAESIATATATAYASLRTGQLSSSIDNRIDQVNTQLASVQQALAAASPSTATSITPAAAALQVQYQQLLQTADSLALSKTQVSGVVSVLTPAAAVTPGALSGAGTPILLGAILGAVVAVVVLLAVRRFSPRVRSVGDLTALGVPALLPVLGTRAGRRGRGAAAWRSNAGRLLAARLSGRQGARQEPLVVVGATPGVGTSHVAASLAAGMVERGPVLLVLATELVHGADARSLRGLSTTDVSADIDLEPAADLTDEVIRRAVQCEIPGVWVLPMGPDTVGEVGPLPSARAKLLADVLARATGAGWQVVVDAPALSESDLGVDSSTAGRGAAVLVVARGVSRPADVVSASELFDVKGSRFRGAILNERPGRFRGGRGPADSSQSLQIVFEPPSLDREPAGSSDAARRRGRRRVPGPARTTPPSAGVGASGVGASGVGASGVGAGAGANGAGVPAGAARRPGS